MTRAPGSPWLNPPGKTAVFLADTGTALEREQVLRWIRETRAAAGSKSNNWKLIGIRSWIAQQRSGAVRQLTRLLEQEAELKETDHLFFIPIRVLWFPQIVNGERKARLRDLFLGDPRDPSALRQRWIYARDSGRCYPIVGSGSGTQDLISRYVPSGRGSTSELDEKAEFILRMAAIALERAERNERGARYKVPRLVKEAIVGKPDFILELKHAAAETGQTEEQSLAKAKTCLKEIAADHSTLFIDLMVALSRYLYRRGYDKQIAYLEEDVKKIRALTQQYPVAFLMTHKTYLDGLIMACLIYELDLPPLHLIGGSNMNFVGGGRFSRKAGTIFIRRSFSDDPIYKLVLKHYIRYLVEKRFPLNWAFEGTRSRTGKLMPPRYGMLRYVVDAAVNLDNTALHLIPVTIAYDQLPDITDYVSEQRGQAKKKESLSWLKTYVDRISRPYGRIHVRFGEPVVVESRRTGEPESPVIDQLALQKLSFQVAVEANRVTPVTATSLISFCLLAHGYKALTLAELMEEIRDIDKMLNMFSIPRAGDYDFSTPESLQLTISKLAANGALICYEEGVEPVYAVATGHKRTIAYYRNTIVHFFVTSAIAELALITASASTARSLEAFYDEAMRLRDLLKFEFFFSEKKAFIEEINSNLDQRLPDWRVILCERPSSLEEMYPVVAHCTLRTFFDAYKVVADVLSLDVGESQPGDRAIIDRCMKLGSQMVLQQRIASDDAVNSFYFSNALRLAESRGLMETGAEEKRRILVAEIGDVLYRMDLIAAFAERGKFRYKNRMQHRLKHDS